jgi:hypothetical protein
MTKTININRLEIEIEDHFLEAAEALISSDALIDFEQNELMYYAQFGAESVVVAEVKMNGNHAVKYKCDCKISYNKKLCSHIVATFIKIKASKKAIKEEKTVVPKPKKETNPQDNLNIDYVFHNTNIYDLQAFIKDIAKKDRGINLLLKATFIAKIYHESVLQKYKLLWTSIENYVIEKNNRLLPKGQQLLKKLLQTQINVVEDSLVENDFAEAIPCLLLATESSLMILKRTSADVTFFEKQYQKIVTLFLEIAEKNLTFETTKTLHEFALLKMHRRDFEYLGLNTVLVKLCQKTMTNADIHDILIEKLLETKQNDLGFYTQNMVLVSVEYFQHNKTELGFELFEQHQQSLDYIYALSNTLLTKGNYKIVDQIIAQIRPVSEQHFELADKINLESAIYQNKTENIDNQALKLFLETYDLKYFDLMKTNSRKKWPKILLNILVKLNQQPYSLAKRDLIGFIYFSEYTRKELVDFLTETLSVDLILQYTNSIVYEFPTETLTIYSNWAAQYLNQHLGLQGAKRVKEVMEKLFEMGHADLVKDLRDAIFTEFPNRNSIIEALEDVLKPKKKRIF